jgi:serine/threonine-protein kinase
VRLGPAPTVPPPPPPADDVEDKTLDSDAAAPALGSGSGSRSATDAPVRSAPPGYEILGELGRGGMGVVFRARDQRLGRTVALKMILAGSYAGGEDQARFRLEAEAVAGLQHPNIVQIFEIGSHQGLPFLSLEYCGGGSLAARMAGKPLPARQAAQIAEVVARAAAAAHATGIIHRDIKPGNVLLTETGTPKLTDFGLAKRVDSAGPTATGSALGTPSYMAPEQVDGARNLGPPADVHAIGATLYEMLTGRPPYAGESEVHTIWMVMSQDPVPVRRLQPKAPVDLETICLKCLQKDPRRRYRTAAELADDLRRFLAGQPITARPVGSMELASRWCRRNPAAAGLAAMLVAAVTAGLAGVTWKWREADGLRIVAEVERRDAERSRDQAETARAEAVRSRDDARDNYERAERHRADAERAYIALERERDAAETARAEAVKQREAARSAHAAARAAVDESFTLVSESKLLKMPGLQPLRKELLTAALKYYSKFAEDRAEDPASTAERAAALGRLAIITREIGDPAESLRLLDDQIKAMTPAAGGRIEPDAAAALASAHSNRGVVLSAMGRHEEAVSALRMAVDLQEKVVRARPGELNRLSELAAYLGNLGYHLNFTFQNAEALRTLQRAVKICEEMAAAKPDDPETQNGLAGALTNLATTQLTLGRRDQGRILLERVRTLYEALAAKAPGDAEIAENLARTFANLAATRDQTPEGDEAAVADLKRSIEIRERLAREHPAVLEHRARVGYGLVGLASQLRNLKRADEAAGMLERALELYTRLVAEAGTVSDYHAGRAMALNYLGEIRNEAGRAEDGDKLRAEARQILERLVRDVPGDPGYSSLLGVMWLIDARVHEKAGRISEALASVALAIEQAKVAAGKSPATATFRSNLAQSHIVRAGLLRGRGDHAAAAASLADARAAGADGGEVRFQIAGEYARLSKAVGAAPEAALHADLAMDLLREAVAKGVRDPARFADQALDPLRDRADFKLLVGGLKPPVM